MKGHEARYILLCFAVSFGAMFDGGYTITYVNTAEANFKLFLNESWAAYFHPGGLNDVPSLPALLLLLDDVECLLRRATPGRGASCSRSSSSGSSSATASSHS